MCFLVVGQEVTQGKRSRRAGKEDRRGASSLDLFLVLSLGDCLVTVSKIYSWFSRLGIVWLQFRRFTLGSLAWGLSGYSFEDLLLVLSLGDCLLTVSKIYSWFSRLGIVWLQFRRFTLGSLPWGLSAYSFEDLLLVLSLGDCLVTVS
ncbi:hypothetical protein BgiBS90_030446 [Biomphalaria glabrata]|nr:hypothetical protein BgiBS90_030446 [Biomphalaria glabrata]